MSNARPFVVCIHDVTPAYAREMQSMLRDLAPLIGRDLSFGVVPDWHGAWPLIEHRDFCGFVQESAEELLLHGYTHRRRRGRGAVWLLTGGSDEMNGLDDDETRSAIEHGQRAFADAFGAPARGFLAPAWQRGRVEPGTGIDFVAGFVALRSADARVPLATWTWDCGRWRWLGHVGHEVGWLLQSVERVPVLAVHPSDLRRGYWPAILGLTSTLLTHGYEPRTMSHLLESRMPDSAAGGATRHEPESQAC